MCVSETDLSMATGKDNKAEAIGSAEVEITEITVTITTIDCFSLKKLSPREFLDLLPVKKLKYTLTG